MTIWDIPDQSVLTEPEPTKQRARNPEPIGYLQVYSEAGTFGGLNTPPELASAFRQLPHSHDEPVAVALTDTFSLRATSQWAALLAESGIRPIVGSEIALKWAGSHNLPFALILLATNERGYQNLCRLISIGLEEAGTHPLTAALETAQLGPYREGLVAIAPYYGGPITGALQASKTAISGVTEAKNRAVTLRDIFGPENFFLGVPPVLTAPLPLPTFTGDEKETAPDLSIKINATLTRIAREQKIGLIVTGETRYCEAEQAGDYAALQNRLGRALAEQFQPNQLHQKTDWLYSLSSGHPLANLQVQSPQVLLARYQEAEWPEAIVNNRKVTQRCTAFGLPHSAHAAHDQLQKRCLEEISQRYAAPKGQSLPEEMEARAWLDNELSAIGDLGLAEPLLIAAHLYDETSPSQVLLARWLSGSLVAYLLGLTERAPVPDAFNDSPYSRFETFEGHRSLRIETGRDGRARLITMLNANAGAFEANDWIAAPVATPSSETGALALVHPRLTAFGAKGRKLNELLPLQPAQLDSTGLTCLAAQVGPTPPAYVSVLEIRQSAALARLQLALDLLNNWKQQHGQTPLEVRHLPRAPENDYDTPNEFERALIKERLNFFRAIHPAAYYGATLSLVDPEQRLAQAEAARQTNLQILSPSINQSQADFSMVDENTVRVGLAAVLGHITAHKLLEARGPRFESLDDFAHKADLDASQIGRLVWSGALDEFGPREALAEIGNQLVQTGQNYRERQQPKTNSNAFIPPHDEQQPTLFSLMSADDLFSQDATAPEQLPSLQLPDVPSLSALERLKRQHDALGFYTSTHPLWSLRSVRSSDATKTDFTPLTDLANQQPETAGQNLRVAGLIVGLRRLPLTEADGKGRELTLLKLEDWDGRAELLVPPGVVEVSGLDNLDEGRAVAALVRTDTAQPGPVSLIVAEALAAYSPQADLFDVVGDDNFDIEAELDKLKKEAWAELQNTPAPVPSDVPPSDTPPPDDWSAQLFEAVGAGQPVPETKREATKPAAKNAAITKDKKAARPLQRRASLFLPDVDSEDEQEQIMVNIQNLLRRYPGTDQLWLYAPREDGKGHQRFETVTMTVAISPPFEQEARQLLGQDGLKIEEY